MAALRFSRWVSRSRPQPTTDKQDAQRRLALQIARDEQTRKPAPDHAAALAGSSASPGIRVYTCRVVVVAARRFLAGPSGRVQHREVRLLRARSKDASGKVGAGRNRCSMVDLGIVMKAAGAAPP
jgi:hypothetical protein